MASSDDRARGGIPCHAANYGTPRRSSGLRVFVLLLLGLCLLLGLGRRWWRLWGGCLCGCGLRQSSPPSCPPPPKRPDPFTTFPNRLLSALVRIRMPVRSEALSTIGDGVNGRVAAFRTIRAAVRDWYFAGIRRRRTVGVPPPGRGRREVHSQNMKVAREASGARSL